MRGLLLRHNKKFPVAIEPVASAFPSLKNAEIAAAFAGERRAGDFYDSIRVNPSRVLFGLLDIAGRRQQNQAILSTAQSVFRQMGAKLLGPADANEADAMTELCLSLNRAIMDAAGGVHSSPAFAACYNEDNGILCYVNSGHTPALVRHGDGISELGATGLPLGLFSISTSEARVLAMEPGSALAVVSRGVVETECKKEEFGLSGVESALKKASLTGAQAVCHFILDDVQRFACSAPNQNDITALALVRSASA
jgi:sigma-B regulation protein RsbU (phosphoserine phosphatase)